MKLMIQEISSLVAEEPGAVAWLLNWTQAGMNNKKQPQST